MDSEIAQLFGYNRQMGTERLYHIGGWLFALALNMSAGIVASYAAWALVAVFALSGLVVLGVAHWPEVIQQIKLNGLLSKFNLRSGSISVLTKLALLGLITYLATNAYRYWSVPNPTLFQPEFWPRAERSFGRRLKI